MVSRRIVAYLGAQGPPVSNMIHSAAIFAVPEDRRVGFDRSSNIITISSRLPPTNLRRCGQAQHGWKTGGGMLQSNGGQGNCWRQ